MAVPATASRPWSKFNRHGWSKFSRRQHGINPQQYLRYVLERIAEHPINRIDELLPWVVADQIAPDTESQPEQELSLAA